MIYEILYLGDIYLEPTPLHVNGSAACKRQSMSARLYFMICKLHVENRGI